MAVACIVVVGVTIVLNAWAATADFTRAAFVIKTSAEVRIPKGWIPILGALKGVAAIGLALGLLGHRVVGISAAAGLVVFFVGAVVAHIRACVYYNIAFPAIFLTLAAASLALSLRN